MANCSKVCSQTKQGLCWFASSCHVVTEASPWKLSAPGARHNDERCDVAKLSGHRLGQYGVAFCLHRSNICTIVGSCDELS